MKLFLIIILSVFFSVSIANEKTHDLHEEYSEGLWSDFLSENEKLSEEYILNHDPMAILAKMSKKERKQIVNQYFEYLNVRKKEVIALFLELMEVFDREGVSLPTMGNVGAEEPGIANKVALMQLPVFCLTQMSGYGIKSLYEIELGLDKRAPAALQPFLVTFAVRAYLAEEERAELIAMERWERYKELLDELDDDTYIDWLERLSSWDMWISTDRYLNHLFADFHALATGEREPIEPLEVECLPILIKYQKLFTSDWNARESDLRFWFIRIGSFD